MPKAPQVPSYRFHKARSLAVVTLDGKAHYLGPYGSPKSHALYKELTAAWLQKQMPRRHRPIRGSRGRLRSANWRWPIASSRLVTTSRTGIFQSAPEHVGRHPDGRVLLDVSGTERVARTSRSPGARVATGHTTLDRGE